MFNSEPGRPSGNIVTSRKGGVFLGFEITGKAAHSGGNFEKGISAIGEMAHKIVAMHKLTDLKRGITVNVGLVKGGQSVNTTAPHAEGQIDLRYVKPEQRASALAALQAIIDSATVAGTTAKLEIRGEFLPLSPTPASEELFGCYQAAAADAGLKIAGEFTGGCAELQGSRRRSGVRRCAGSDRSAPTRTRPRSTSRSRPWCRAPRPWRSPSCACRRPPNVRDGVDEPAAPPAIVHDVKERRPAAGGSRKIMPRLEEAGIRLVAVNVWVCTSDAVSRSSLIKVRGKFSLRKA